MIADSDWERVLADWRRSAPWQRQAHVLQDLVLSRIIVEACNDKRLRRRLVFHGGACLHKIWHDAPMRYSEDLYFLCVKPWHLPVVMRRMKKVMRDAGWTDVKSSFWRYPSLVASGLGGYELDMKVDFNPTRRASRRASRNRSSRGSLIVDSDWYRGQAPHIPCASPTDILASKIAATMERNKPRDLADLCTGIDAGIADVDEVIDAYHARYRRKSHPKSLSEGIDSLMSDEAYRQELEGSSDFMPAHFTEEMLRSVVSRIDDAMSRPRHHGGAERAAEVDESQRILEAVALAAARESGASCNRLVKSTQRPCFLRRGHKGRCRSIRRFGRPKL